MAVFIAALAVIEFDSQVVNVLLPLSSVFNSLQNDSAMVWIQVLVWAVVDFALLYGKHFLLAKGVKYSKVGGGQLVEVDTAE